MAATILSADPVIHVNTSATSTIHGTNRSLVRLGGVLGFSGIARFKQALAGVSNLDQLTFRRRFWAREMVVLLLPAMETSIVVALVARQP